jgi:hypothetical protein
MFPNTSFFYHPDCLDKAKDVESVRVLYLCISSTAHEQLEFNIEIADVNKNE